MYKTYVNKILNILLALTLIVNSLFVCNVEAETNKYNFYANNIQEYAGIIEDDYSCSTVFSDSHDYSFKYDDRWFIDNYAYYYNHEIANFMIKASMAAMDSDDIYQIDPSKNIRSFFDSLGYSYTDNTKQNETQDSSDSIVYPHNTMYFDYTNPEKDTIGYGIGYKNVDFKDEGKYTYIGVAVRGSGYRSEWASNFTIGDSNDAYGFKQAADRIESKLIDYIDSINTPYPIKIWITGYSRGGTVSNILAHNLNSYVTSNNIGVKPENIFTYTFEAPMGKDTKTNSNEATYKLNGRTVNLDNNIFNLGNTIDIVRNIVMDDLGFDEYGVKRFYPSSLTTSDYYNSTYYNNMFNTYKNVLNYDPYTSYYANNVSEYVYQESNQKLLIDFYLGTLSNAFGNDRTNYSKADKTNAQKVLRMILGGMETDAEISNIDLKYEYEDTFMFSTYTTTDSLTINLNNTGNIDYFNVASFALKLINKKNKDKVLNYDFTITMSNGNKETLHLTASQFNIIYNAIPNSLTKMIDDGLGLDDIITILKNKDFFDVYADYYGDLFDIVAYSHYPELSLSWVDGNPALMYKNGQYNKVVINANANVSVTYKGNNVCVVNNSDNNMTVHSDNKLEAIINEDTKVKTLYVPNDSDYVINISLTSKGTSSNTIDVETYNIHTGNYKIRNFSVSLSNAASGTNYILNLGKNSESLTKDGVSQSLSVTRNPDLTDVNIQVVSNDTNKGTVTGSNTYHLYDEVCLTATPKTGYELDGWYNEANGKIGEDLQQYINAENTEIITGSFTPIEYNITYDLDDGIATNPTTYNIETNTFKLNNPVKNGYTFVGWTNDGVKEPQLDVSISKGSIGDLTFKANYEKSTHLLTVQASSPAMAQGQGYYLPGESVTVKTINNVLGYTFDGWYECEDNTPKGDRLSDQETYTFTMPNKEYNLIAVYKTEALFTLEINASEFTVNGLDNEESYYGQFPAGSTITLEYTGSSPLAYWKSGNKLVSTSSRYEFIITNNTSLKVITEGKLYRYAFISAYDQLLLMQKYVKDSPIYAPRAPFKSAVSFVGWQIDGQNEYYDANTIGDKIAEYISTSPDNKIVYVRPMYEAITGESTLTIKYRGITKDDDIYNYDTAGYNGVTPKGTGNFLYWEMDGKIISYNNKCYFYLSPGDDKVATAVYGDTAVSRIPVSYLAYAQTEDQESMTFSFINTIPSPYQAVKYGVIYTKETGLNDESKLIYGSGSSAITESEKDSTASASTYSYKILDIASKDLTYYVRGFVVVKDSNGKLTTYYSDIYEFNINELIK